VALRGGLGPALKKGREEKFAGEVERAKFGFEKGERGGGGA
jgi:hypothetical protein